MVMIKFTIKKTCSDSAVCHENIHAKIETLTKNLRTFDNGKLISTCGHVSISHKPEHTIWLFLYSHNKKHEGENSTTKKIRIADNDKVKKYTGVIPTESDIRKII